jgi:hypothetical protein
MLFYCCVPLAAAANVSSWSQVRSNRGDTSASRMWRAGPSLSYHEGRRIVSAYVLTDGRCTTELAAVS